MELELARRCCDLDAMDHDVATRSDLRMKILWGAAYKLRATDVPEMLDTHLEYFIELSYLTSLPAFRYITIQEYVTILQRLPKRYQTFFAHIVKLMKLLDAHGSAELATDKDWEEWIESM